jgi:hypothetical protein
LIAINHVLFFGSDGDAGGKKPHAKIELPDFADFSFL